jgi:hypothetical protein
LSLLNIAGIRLVSAAQLIGILSYIGLLIISLTLFRKYRNETSIYNAILPFVLIATNFPLIIWSLSGLETELFAFLIAISIYILIEIYAFKRNCRKIFLPVLNGSLFAMAAMTRPEGVLIFGIVSLFLIINWKRINARYFFYLISSFLLVWGTYYIWRWDHYGYFFPNTFYVKDRFSFQFLSFALWYFWAFFKSPPFLMFIAAMMIIHLLFKRVKFELKELLLISIIVIYSLYIIYTTGDHMPAYRFFMPISPLIILLIFYLVQRIENKYILFVHSIIILFIVFQVILAPKRIYLASNEDWAAMKGEVIGKFIDGNFPPNSLIAANTAGSTPFYAPNDRFIDMLGLCDTTIAHRQNITLRTLWQKIPGHFKGDGKYILSRKPDYIIIGPANGMKIDSVGFLSDLEISQQPEFYMNYYRCDTMLELRYKQGLLGREEAEPLPFLYYKRRK